MRLLSDMNPKDREGITRASQTMLGETVEDDDFMAGVIESIESSPKFKGEKKAVAFQGK